MLGHRVAGVPPHIIASMRKDLTKALLGRSRNTALKVAICKADPAPRWRADPIHVWAAMTRDFLVPVGRLRDAWLRAAKDMAEGKLRWNPVSGHAAAIMVTIGELEWKWHHPLRLINNERVTVNLETRPPLDVRASAMRDYSRVFFNSNGVSTLRDSIYNRGRS